jgi:Rad3-related DNA helicase
LQRWTLKGIIKNKVNWEVGKTVLSETILDRITDFWPKSDNIKSLRDIQKDALLQIASMLKAGHKRIVISGPTGMGKSLLIVTIARMFQAMGMNTTITSPLNLLVDQISKNYSNYVYTLKGRQHYTCEVAKQLGLRTKTTCSEGFCQSKKCGTKYINDFKNFGEQKNASISYKPLDCADCKLPCICNGCEYNIAKSEYINSSIGNTNYTMFTLGLKLDFRNTDVKIIDECELSKSFIRLRTGVTIQEKWPENLSWNQYLELLVETLAEKKEALKKIEESSKCADTEDERKIYAKKMTAAEREIGNINEIISDYAENKEPWVPIFEERINKNKDVTSIVRFEPATTERYETGIYRPDDYVFYFSATPTIPKENGKHWPIIELDSPFPANIRPWVYIPVGSMSFKNRASTIPEMAKFINDIPKKRPGKTLVHCQSYKIAEDLGRYCKDKLNNPYVIVQVPGSSAFDTEGNEIMSANRSLQNFLSASYSNTILFSVNMWNGIDLYQWEGREAVFTQVIAKIPYQNPNDPVVVAQKRILEDAEDQLNEAVAALVMQAYGRINRNDEKYKIAHKKTLTFILDSDWNKWGFYFNNKRLFRRYFKEAEIKKQEIEWG